MWKELFISLYSFRTLHYDAPPLAVEPMYWRARDILFSAELILLRMLRFELEAPLAFWPLIRAGRALFGHMDPEQAPNPSLLSTITLQMATSLVADSYLRSSVLTWFPADLAAAALAVALKGVGCSYSVAAVAKKLGRSVEKIEGELISKNFKDFIVFF